MTIEELSGRSGVPVRTIRYYISQGLLPGASGRGAGARYDIEHLLRLRLIRRLVERHVPLTEIGVRLQGLGTEDIRALLAEEERGAEQTRRAPSPRAYIASLLEQARQPPEPLPVEETAAAYVLPDAAPPPAAAPPPEALAPAGAREEVWRHIELVPGVELRVRSDAELTQRPLIKRLLQATSEHLRRRT